MLLKYSASMAIKSCGITGLGSGLRVDGFGNGGSLVLVVFAVAFFAVVVFGFAFAVFGFAFACAIGFAFCAVTFFATGFFVAGFAFALVGGFVFLAEDGFFAVGFFAVVFALTFAMIFLLSIDVLGYTHTAIIAFLREIEKAEIPP